MASSGASPAGASPSAAGASWAAAASPPSAGAASAAAGASAFFYVSLTPSFDEQPPIFLRICFYW